MGGCSRRLPGRAVGVATVAVGLLALPTILVPSALPQASATPPPLALGITTVVGDPAGSIALHGNPGSAYQPSADGTTLQDAVISQPLDVAAFNENTVFFLDNGNDNVGGSRPDTVRKIDLTANRVTTVSSLASPLNEPYSLAIAPDGATAYVGDFVSGASGASQIRKVNLTTGAVSTMSLSLPASTVLADKTPVAISPDGATLYVDLITTGLGHQLGAVSVASGSVTGLNHPVCGDGVQYHPAECDFRDTDADIDVDATGRVYIDIESAHFPAAFRNQLASWSAGTWTTMTGQWRDPRRFSVDSSGSIFAFDATPVFARYAYGELASQTTTVQMGCSDTHAFSGCASNGSSQNGFLDGRYGKVGTVVGGLDSIGRRVYFADSTNNAIRVTVSPFDESLLIGGPLSADEMQAGGSPSEICPICQQGPRPITSSNGEFWHTFTDVAVPGRGVALGLTRTYSSNDAAVDGPFGYGWTFSYAAAVVGTSTSATVTVREENGAELTFTNVAGAWVAPPRVEATLTWNSGSSTWTFVRKGRLTMTFNASGQLTGLTDRNGYTTTLSYTGTPSRLDYVQDPAGRRLTFGWTGSHITTVSDPRTSPGPRQVAYHYNSSGELDQVTDVDGNVWKFFYDNDLTGASGHAFHRLTNMRDPRQVAVGSTTHDVVNVYDSFGRVTSQTDQLGHTTTFDYSSIPGAVKITEPSSNVANVKVEYFTDGLLTKMVVGYGSASPATWLYSHDPNEAGVTAVTDPNGFTTTSTYDSAGNRTSVDPPFAPATASASFNQWGEPGTVTAPGTGSGTTVTTSYTYDTAGNLLSVSTPIGGQNQVSTFRYEDATHPGDLTSSSDPAHTYVNSSSVQTRYQYDTYGMLNRVDAPIDTGGTATSTWSYNEIGWLLSTVPPRGNTAGATPSNFDTVYSNFDGYGVPGTVTDALNHAQQFVYDDNENLVSVTDARSNVTGYVFDAANRLTTVDRPTADGVNSDLTNGYYADDSLQFQQDGAGNQTVYTYDALGNPSTVTTPATSEFTAGHTTTTYVYDGAGRLLSRQDPDGNCAASPKVACTTFGYSATTGLPTTVTYSDGITPNITATTYDNAGRRAGRTLSNGVTEAWTYDNLGRLTSSNDGTGTTSYEYSLANVRTSITYPGTGATCAGTRKLCAVYSVDDGNRVNKLEFYDSAGTLTTTNFHLDAEGREDQITFPSATTNVDIYTFDNAGAMSTATFKQGATVLGAFTYGRDANNQLTSDARSGTAFASATETYTYNARNQLCFSGTYSGQCTNTPSGDTTWNFNTADDLTRTTANAYQGFEPGGELCYTATTVTGSTTCSASGGASNYVQYNYDSRGNRTDRIPTTGSPTTYTWDQANRLTSVRQQAAAGNAGEFHPVTLARIMDTRAGVNTGNCTGAANTCTTIPAGGGTRSLLVTGQAGIPSSGVDAIVINITVTGEAAAGNLVAYEQGTMTPGTSNVNFLAGYAISNMAIVPVSASGSVSFTSSAGTDVIVDIEGWYSTPSGTSGSEFNAVTPTRVLDTRAPVVGTCSPSACATIPANSTLSIKIAGASGSPVPSGAATAALNVVAVGATVPGNADLYPTGTSDPGLSNLTFQSGQTIAELGIYALSASGYVTIANHSSATLTVIIDVEGYTTPASGTNVGASYVAAPAPFRLVDQRVPTGPCLPTGCPTTLSNTGTLDLRIIGGTSPVPAGASAVAINLTVLGGTHDPGNLVAYAGDLTTAPSASTINYATSDIANAAIVRLSPDGRIKIKNSQSSGSVVILVDIVGWYTSAWSYTYNSDGLRTTKAGPDSSTTSFVWDHSTGIPLLLEETAGAITTYYTYGPDGQPIAEVTGTTARYLHHDQIGSTRLITSGTGANSATATYDPYGSPLVTTGTMQSRLGFAGQYTDAETSLVYLRARYYEPAAGQFINRDPASIQTRDPYGYAARQPTSYSDPSGLDWWDPRDWDQTVVGWVEDAPEAALDVALDAADATVGVGPRLLSDWTGLTVGGCVGGNLTAPLIDRSLQVCYVATPDGDSGFLASGGAGAGVPSAGWWVGPMISNADQFADLRGRSDYLYGGYGPVTGGASWGSNDCGDTIVSITGGYSESFSPFLGVSGAAGSSVTVWGHSHSGT